VEKRFLLWTARAGIVAGASKAGARVGTRLIGGLGLLSCRCAAVPSSLLDLFSRGGGGVNLLSLLAVSVLIHIVRVPASGTFSVPV